MCKDTVILLYNYTRYMAQPWLDAGFDVWAFDCQFPDTVAHIDNYHTVGGFIKSTEDIWKYIDKSRVKFIFGFPPCTDLAVSGARHFAKKQEENPNVFKEAMDLVYIVRDLGQESGAPWALENPVSIISTKWRKPDYTFHPWEFGGYLIDSAHPEYPEYIPPNDAYPKKTCIWAGNNFIFPDKKPVEVPEGYSAMYKKLGGKSIKTKNIRSATPRGFALACFLANKDNNDS